MPGNIWLIAASLPQMQAEKGAANGVRGELFAKTG
jgi:hypothetical protein